MKRSAIHTHRLMAGRAKLDAFQMTFYTGLTSWLRLASGAAVSLGRHRSTVGLKARFDTSSALQQLALACQIHDPGCSCASRRACAPGAEAAASQVRMAKKCAARSHAATAVGKAARHGQEDGVPAAHWTLLLLARSAPTTQLERRRAFPQLCRLLPAMRLASWHDLRLASCHHLTALPAHSWTTVFASA